MRTWIRALGALCGLAALLASLVPMSALACELTFGWEPWPPYQMPGDQAAGDAPKGLDIDLVRLIGDRAGCTITFQEVPWARHLKLLEHGKIDGALSATFTEDRTTYGWFTVPYRDELVRLVVRKDDAAILDLHALPDIVAHGMMIGMRNGFFYGDEVEALRSDPVTAGQFVAIDRMDTLIRMLDSKRVAALVGDPFALVHSAMLMGLADHVVIHDLAIQDTPVRFLLSRASVDDETVERLNTAIRDTKQDGSLAEIIARYIGS